MLKISSKECRNAKKKDAERKMLGRDHSKFFERCKEREYTGKDWERLHKK